MTSTLSLAKDSRPGKAKKHTGGGELKVSFRSLKLPSDAASSVTVTIQSGGEEESFPFAAGEMWQITGEKIVSVSPASDIFYWTVQHEGQEVQ